ncbi:MAG: Two component, sigma54 specific, transcriptional regulator, Fis family [Desulfonauticus sp. 38_4375]|nr:MAG: Two component, sigma54 specific, transcriptional regulator, Fis family [Desulfonauticus sp. 38_4375]
MAKRKVLFICKPELITPFYAFFQEQEIEVLLAENFSGAIKSLQSAEVELIFVQTGLPGFRVEGFLAWLEEKGHQVPVYILSKQGNSLEAKKFLEAGAKDYWLLPLTEEKLGLLLSFPQEKKSVLAEQEKISFSNKEILGNHPKIKTLLELAKRVARSKASVLISGESGTGKELLARFIHQHSGRKGPFVAINCAALPEHLLESELFGHEKGAFTGAIARKLGKFELANGGTILLDEVTEMDFNLQAKLLRVLQEEEFDRVGGTESVKVDVRVIATTNRNIEEWIKENKFREDLYYRLNVIPLKIPPLRERGEDILLLASAFVQKFCLEYKLGPKFFSEEAKRWLLNYNWPGNVRELQNLMERAVLIAQENKITSKHFLVENSLEDFVQEQVKEKTEEQREDTLLTQEVLPLAEMEQKMILRSLKLTGGNRSQASQLLGISVRTLRNKLNEYKKQGIKIP